MKGERDNLKDQNISLNERVSALRSDLEILTQEMVFNDEERMNEVKYYKERFELKEKQEKEYKKALKMEVEQIRYWLIENIIFD